MVPGAAPVSKTLLASSSVILCGSRERSRAAEACVRGGAFRPSSSDAEAAEEEAHSDEGVADRGEQSSSALRPALRAKFG